DDLVAAVWGPTDGYAGPAEITSGFARRARELGARILEGVEVTGIDLQAGRVRAVRTTDGTIATSLVVNAAGPAAARVGRLDGLFLAVGFGGHGFQHSAATGRLVAEWLLDGQPSMDLSLFDPGRFARGQAAQHDAGPDAE